VRQASQIRPFCAWSNKGDPIGSHFALSINPKAPPERQETDFTILSLEFWARLLDKSTGANSQALFAKHYA
jgi:hypothetical protein